MAGAWGMPTSGAWSQQVEKEEEEQGGEIQAPAPAPVPTFAQNAAFPTLGDAVKKKESKRDKKPKAQKMNLADFQTSYKPPTASRRPTMNDDQILSSLPTAPRTRGDDDGAPSGLGGAFKDYGGRDRGMSTLMIYTTSRKYALSTCKIWCSSHHRTECLISGHSALCLPAIAAPKRYNVSTGSAVTICL